MLVIVRGAPGSGKSTFAKFLVNEYAKLGKTASVFEADQYFTDAEGRYNFDPKLLSEAHRDCQRRTTTCLEKGSIAIVSNTFTRQWEVEPYMVMAKSLGVKCFIFRCEASFQNVHGVPDSAVQRMRDRMESVRGETVLSQEEIQEFYSGQG